MIPIGMDTHPCLLCHLPPPTLIIIFLSPFKKIFFCSALTSLVITSPTEQPSTSIVLSPRRRLLNSVQNIWLNPVKRVVSVPVSCYRRSRSLVVLQHIALVSWILFYPGTGGSDKNHFHFVQFSTGISWIVLRLASASGLSIKRPIDFSCTCSPGPKWIGQFIAVIPMLE